MKAPRVIVSKGKDPYLTTQDALQRFHPPDLKGKRILIKPNAARLAAPGEGITTHPSVVSATIDYLRQRNAGEIVIGESCIFGVNAEEAFQVTGMAEISKKRGAKLLDLDRMAPMEMGIPGGKIVKKIIVPALLKEFDWILSLPVMKTHMHTRVTLSLKNLKGLLWRKEKARFHQLPSHPRWTKGEKTLDVALSEMATALRPHLVITDGTVGLEGLGPAYGKPKEMGIVLVGDNALSTDAVASRLMGFGPGEIPHLRLSAQKGVGEIDLEKISVEPKDYLKWENPFEPPPSRFSIPFPDVIVYEEGTCSACLSTLLVLLQENHLQLGDYRLEDEKIHIGMGKSLKSCPKGTILIGNCSSNMKSKGLFIPGCPPVPSQIMKTLARRSLREYSV